MVLKAQENITADQTSVDLEKIKADYVTAFETNSWTSVKSILETYPELVDTPQSHNNTALMRAAIRDHAGMATYLLDKGANINAQNQSGDTPLIWACARASYDLVKLLVEKGADLDLTQDSGKTALIRAIQRGSTKTALFLIQAGADTNIKCKGGKTAFDYAVDHNIDPVIKAISEANSQDGFFKQGDHNVFTCQDFPYLGTSIQRVFNFQANEMTRITKNEEAIDIQTLQFAEMVDLSGVAKAAEALEKMGGTPGQSWKNPNFHQKPSQVSLKGKNCA